MARPVVLVVDDDGDVLAALEAALARRFGTDYQILAERSPAAGLRTLERLRRQDLVVAVVIADQWMPHMTGLDLLARVRQLHPSARRLLLIGVWDRSANQPMSQAMTLGRLDGWVLKPWEPAEEHLYLPVSEQLTEWIRATGQPGFVAIQVVGEQWTPRSHQIRDLLDRNAIPYQFHPHDSEAGRRRPGRAVGGHLRRLRGAAYADAGARGAGRAGRQQLADPQLPRLPVRGQRPQPRPTSRRAGDPVWRGAGLRPRGRAAPGRDRPRGHPGRRRPGGRQDGAGRHRRRVPPAGGAGRGGAAGSRVFVVGAGNSAGQAAIHLAKYAEQVTLLVRGEALGRTMSDYLTKELQANDAIAVRLRAQVVAAHGTGRLERLTLHDARTDVSETVPAAALFILIGAQPHTQWLAGTLELDEHGFVLTGRDLPREGRSAPGWPLDRPPLALETSVPGVFAAGDVRHRSTKRVASAVGEGSIAVQLAHDYLGER